MSETTSITDSAPQHPLQCSWIPGPKGVFEVRRFLFGIYVRVDMPGVNSKNVRIRKGDNSEIKFEGFAPRLNNWRLDDSGRVYYGSIKVICEDFDKVSFVQEVKNGSCRLFINGAQDCILDYQTTSADKGKESVKDISEKSLLHQGADSVLIVGMTDSDLVRHRRDCHCCGGTGSDFPFSEPLSEEKGYINPFIHQGVKGVFETKFEPLPDGSGDFSMYFRFDMPDAATQDVLIVTKRIFVEGQSGALHPYSEMDEAAERQYFCRLSLKCDCCCFDVSDNKSSHLQDGVFRMTVKILRKSHNVIKEVASSANVAERISSLLPSTFATESSAPNSNSPRGGGGRHHGQT